MKSDVKVQPISGRALNFRFGTPKTPGSGENFGFGRNTSQLDVYAREPTKRTKKGRDSDKVMPRRVDISAHWKSKKSIADEREREKGD